MRRYESSIRIITAFFAALVGLAVRDVIDGNNPLDVLDQGHPGHGCTSCHRVCPLLTEYPKQAGHHYNLIGEHGDRVPAERMSPAASATSPGV